MHVGSDEIETSTGVALINGTNVEAHRIAALLAGGMTAVAVMRDYPSLTERQVLAAKAFAEINPVVGTHYPPKTAKAALRGSGLAALDSDVIPDLTAFRRSST